MTRCNLIQDMVHIKKVEIFGFKSFGFRNTVVDFRPGLVSISGPNGSGKSNILDAIIFASGEMRPNISTFLICTMSCMRLHRVIDCV